MIVDTPVDPATIYAQLATAPQVLEEAQLPPVIETVLLSGSFAQGRADHLSDVDVHVLAAGDDNGRRSYDPLWDLERALRKHLGSDEVYADWISPDDRSGLLARDLANAKVLFSHNAERLRLLIARLFPGGFLPSVRDVVRATSLSRAHLAISDRHPLPEVLARRCLNLGHEAIRTLGLPVPGDLDGIPGVLLDAGIVRRREAEWVLWRLDLSRRPWEDLSCRDFRHCMSYGADLGRDFAWHTLNALERAYFEQMR